MRLCGHNVKWMFRQLLPLHYRSHYSECVQFDPATGVCTEKIPHFAVWRMWFGRVFAHDDVVVG